MDFNQICQMAFIIYALNTAILVMSMCRIFSCVVGRGCLLWPVRSLGKTLLAFALVHSVLQGQICLLPGVSWLPIFAFQSPIMKRTSFWDVSSRRSCRSSWTHGHHQMVNTEIRLIIFFAAKDGVALYSQQKQDQELIVAQIMNSLLQNSDLNWRK